MRSRHCEWKPLPNATVLEREWEGCKVVAADEPMSQETYLATNTMLSEERGGTAHFIFSCHRFPCIWQGRRTVLR